MFFAFISEVIRLITRLKLLLKGYCFTFYLPARLFIRMLKLIHYYNIKFARIPGSVTRTKEGNVRPN